MSVQKNMNLVVKDWKKFKEKLHKVTNNWKIMSKQFCPLRKNYKLFKIIQWFHTLLWVLYITYKDSLNKLKKSKKLVSRQFLLKDQNLIC